MIEKIMHKQLYAFLEKHNILFQNQFGFRKNNSTVYALAQITEMIKVSIDSGKFGCGIFIDLRKAFNTVNHEILLNKLKHYGIYICLNGFNPILVIVNNMFRLMLNHLNFFILLVGFLRALS